MKAQMTLMFTFFVFFAEIFYLCLLFLAAMAGTKSRHKETKV